MNKRRYYRSAKTSDAAHIITHKFTGTNRKMIAFGFLYKLSCGFSRKHKKYKTVQFEHTHKHSAKSQVARKIVRKKKRGTKTR